MKCRLTDKSVATLPARGSQTEYHDTVLRGLLLRVTAAGARSYGLRYRFAGQPRRLHIGVVGVLSLTDARQQARALLADVAKRTDPAATREAERRAAEQARRKSERNIRALAAMWLSSKESAAWRPGTRQEFGRITRRVVVPVLGDRDANSVTRGEVRKLLDDVAEGRGLIGEGPSARPRTKPAPTEANRVYATLHLFYA
jgi:hypothetical protein